MSLYQNQMRNGGQGGISQGVALHLHDVRYLRFTCRTHYITKKKELKNVWCYDTMTQSCAVGTNFQQ